MLSTREQDGIFQVGGTAGCCNGAHKKGDTPPLVIHRINRFITAEGVDDGGHLAVKVGQCMVDDCL